MVICHTVDVGGTAGVVAREDRLHIDNTVLVTGLDTAEPGGVDVGLIGGVTVTAGNDTGVDTGGVAVPEIGVDIGDGLAGVGVDQLDVYVEGDTLLVLDDVLTDEFAGDVVRALSDIGAEDASSLGSEQDAGVSGSADTNQGGVVVGVQDAVEGAGLVEVGICVIELVSRCFFCKYID